jgi:hypothetical protein
MTVRDWLKAGSGSTKDLVPDNCAYSPVVVIGVAVTVPVFAFGVRRLLGLRVSLLRWVIGGIVALALAFASPIITAIGGRSSSATADGRSYRRCGS